MCEVAPEWTGGAANHLRKRAASSRRLAWPLGERICQPNFKRSSIDIEASNAQLTFVLRRLLSVIEVGFIVERMKRSNKHANNASFVVVEASISDFRKLLATSVDI